MKKLLFWSVLILVGIVMAQNPHHNILLQTATDADSLILPMIGVISGPIPLPDSPAPDVSEQLKDIGVNSIRNNGYMDDRLDLAQIFCCSDTGTYPSWDCDPYDESHYHWGPSDTLFQIFMDNGFEPFLRLGDEPQSHYRHHDFAGPQNDQQERNWIIAAIKTVERYQHWQGRDHCFNYLDIITEWPNKDFYDRPKDAFIRFWARAFDSLKTHFPQYKIGGPGFLATTMKVIDGDASESNEAVLFLKYLYENNLRPDWIGWHLWYNDPMYYYRAGKQFRDLLDGVGDFTSVPWAGSGFFNGVEVICGAWGVSSRTKGGQSDLPRSEQDKLMNQKEGAAMVTGDWIAMQYTDVQRTYYYRANDGKTRPDAGPNDPDMGWSGLFFGDEKATYKPKAHAFRLWSVIANNYPHFLKTDLPSTCENDTTRLWVMGGVDDQGNYAVLLANTNGVDVDYSLAINGKPVTLDNFEKVDIYQVDNVKDGRTLTVWHGGTFTIGQGCVQLIELQPKTTGIKNAGQKPSQFRLMNNYPNPFNPTTKISYFLGKNCQVTLTVYDIQGKLLQTLVKGKQNAGEHQIVFDGKDLPSGIYFYRMSTNSGWEKAGKMVLLR